MDHWQPLAELAHAVKTKQLKALDLVKRALANIDKYSDYQTVISVLKDEALNRASQVDQRISEGKEVGLLAGVPYVAKDNFLVYGSDTTAASNILKGFKAPYQSTAINKLEAADAICVAKTNLDAFAHGASTENSDFFVSRNPLDKSRVPGGSSGGSAAAVALGIVPFALGTDTGGSIRQPASFCGVYGYKPTYGLVSRSGVVAMGSSLDCVGPITNSADDAAIVLELISGRDELDSTAIEKDEEGYQNLKMLSLKGAKIGLVSEYMGEGLNEEIRHSINKVVNQLKDAGASIVEISLPSVSLALACYYIICPAEVSSNLSRYDGQRYGFSDRSATTLEASYINSRGRGFGSEAKRRIMIGTYVLSSGYYDAYYKKAQIVRTKLIQEFAEAFTKVDFLVGPVTPTTAFKIGQNSHNPLDMYLADIMTVAADLVGIPAASIPIGLDTQGLPIGFQVMARQKEDRFLLELSKSVEELVK